MAERQLHGFTYQKDIIARYNLIDDKEYIGEWDAYYHDIPVSIKTEKYKTDIEMADIYRQYNINCDFILQVGFWKGNKNHIVEEHTLLIKANEYHQLFDKNILEEYKILLKEITNSHDDDTKWKKAINNLRSKWEKNTSNLIRPRPKRDHKEQKRIQCAINNKDFYRVYLPKYEEVDFFERNH